MKKIWNMTLVVMLLMSCGTSQNKTLISKDMINYEKEWAAIESLREQGLPKSLAPKVENIYQSAMQEQNYEQMIKAIIYQMNGIGMLEENDVGANRIFNQLKKDAETLPQPAKSVVYSMIGQMYETYYTLNAWTISERTYTEVSLEDVLTWDARKLAEEAVKYYLLSLQEAKTLQNEPVDNYKEILNEGYSVDYQPSLYDVLANRALTYFVSNFHVHNIPQQTFIVNDPDYFADALKFSKLDIQSEDTLATGYLSLKTYQEALRFHLEKSNFGALIGKANDDIKALIDIDLRRMDYLRLKGLYADNDRLYEEALIRMSAAYRSYDENARILLQLADLYVSQGASWRNNKTEHSKSGYVKAYEICDRIEKEYPGQLTSNVEMMRKSILDRNLTVKFEEVQLPDKPFLAILEYRNMEAVYMTVYKMTDEEILRFNKERPVYNSQRKATLAWIRQLKNKPVIEKITLPHVSDYQPCMTEISISSLERGYYLMLVSDTEDLTDDKAVFSISHVQVSSLMALDRMVDGRMSVAVTDRQTGAPVEGAKITVCNDTSELLSFVSEKNGIGTSVQFSDRINSRHYKVENAGDRLFVYNPRYNMSIYKKQPQDVMVFFTDRAIYRPGQTVYYKAILFRKDEKDRKELKKNTSATIRLRSVNWQDIIAEHTHQTNEFGSFEGSFTIPQGLLNGRMSIEYNGFDQTSIQVEEYKRPTFEVKFDPIEGNIALNKLVKVTANAKALAGYAIDNANVQYRIVRNSRYRYYYWWFPPLNDAREIASGVLKTDKTGNVAIEFTTLADDVKDDRIYMYTVTADITDVNGETRSAILQVNAGNNPLLINTNLSETIQSGQRDRFTVETTNLNGDFTPASVKVEIITLKAPDKILRKRIWTDKIDVLTIPEATFRKNFPLDEYDNELNPDQLKELKKVAEYTLETAENKKLDLSSLKQTGYYKIKMTADSKTGWVADQVQYVYLMDDKPERISDMSQWFTVLKDNGEPGEQAAFLLAGGENNSFVYCELIHNDQLVESKWIKTGTTPVKVSFPIEELHRGGFAVQFSMIQNNRLYSQTQQINVPFTNKMLDVSLATFRDKLLPGENETWTLSVSNKRGEKEAAEMVASLYDASLEALATHSWPSFSSVYNSFVSVYMYYWSQTAIHNPAIQRTYHTPSPTSWMQRVFYTDINWYDGTYRNAFSSFPYRSLAGGIAGRVSLRSSVASVDESFDEALVVENEAVVSYRQLHANEPVEELALSLFDGGVPLSSQDVQKQAELSAIETRTNFNETAFFYPALRTNEKGEILIEFTMPEALTRWKLLSFAHTQDLKIGTYENELITQKQVAISLNPPRFFRENDVIELTAKVNNLTENDLKGQAMLRLYDAVTMEPVDAIIQSEKTVSFEVKTGGSAGLRWKLAIPADIQAITYKVTAQADTHSDGEEKTVPVLTNAMLVTETLPFSVRAGKEKTFTFEKLAKNQSKTLRHHSLTLEYTSTPAWYAVQALPYIMEYPYECAEQTFSRYYANTLATTVVNKMPRIKQVFDTWNALGSSALMSNLEKNQELKQVMLEETPWVMQANNETERKKRIGLLFDLNRMSNELTRAFNKLKNVQNNDGGFPWFEGQPSSRYITQHIVAGMAHLEKLNAMQEKNATDAAEIVQSGLRYLDQQISTDYNRLIKEKADLKKRQISSIQLHYLYACSFSRRRPEAPHKEVFDYYLTQAGQYWKEFTTYEKALAVLVLHRYGQTDKAAAIIRSLKEYAQQSEEMGMYWKDNVAGYFWYQAPIETQAMLIEAFDEAADDPVSVEEMKIWLLRNKQTNDWRTTKATSEAIYALLMTGSNLLDESKLLEIELAGKPLATVAQENIKPEPGTGYVKTVWQGKAVSSDMGRLKVKNPNAQGIAWGGMYWQYFEQLDKITFAETNLKMNKQLFLRTLTQKGEVLQPVGESYRLKVGDLVRVRMELRADRDYEYVHLKDMRASGFEPVSTLSGHRFQDGLWYYESVKDASTNFFITYLPKGTYVFEYDLRVSHAGHFSNGITTFQCMYAPEFSAHSEGIRVTMEALE